MGNELTLFPSSLPDETLHSLVSRYHLLIRNHSHHTTFLELFQRPPFPLNQIVPPHIETLASKLPGEPRSVLKQLVLEHTLLPLFLPYLAPQRPTHIKGDPSEVVSHIPRRVVGMHGDAQLCLHCVSDDKQAFGMPYWHRAHQIPGVTVCWRHNTRLINSCPNCQRPFLFNSTLFTLPWKPCRCGWRPPSIPDLNLTNPNREALQHALFCHDLLAAALPPIPAQHLFETYRKQAIALGFKYGSDASTDQLETAICEYFGEALLCLIDPAYASKRARHWLRLTTYQSALDTPITRHILLGLFLFGSVDQLIRHLKQHPCDDTARGSPRKMRNNYEEAFEELVQEREQHRTTLLKIKRRQPDITVKALWKQAKRAMDWLYDCDRPWLQTHVLQNDESSSPRASINIASREAKEDAWFATLVEEHARDYYVRDVGKPKRLTLGRLLAVLPKHMVTSAGYRERYPLTFNKAESLRESCWHFRARSILWAIQELRAIDEPPTLVHIVEMNKQSYGRIQDIIEYCQWDCAQLSVPPERAHAFLLSIGIPHNWLGPRPPDHHYNGGRRIYDAISYLDLIPQLSGRRRYADRTN